MKFRSNILIFFADLYRVWRRELRLVFRDEGVVIFFLVLCAVYPVLYALIYNTETVRDVKMVVVDDNRSAMSRDFVRRLDATPEVEISGYAANMQEAQRLMHEKECYAIVYFPRDFEKKVSRGEQSVVSVYCDMGAMIRYKQVSIAMSNVQQAVCGEVLAGRVSVLTNGRSASFVQNKQVSLGNTAMGLASAVLPCILIMVLQQSMLLGIGMLRGGGRERRIANRGYDPMDVGAGVIPTVVGKTLCHFMIYVVPTLYVLCIVPRMFDFPQNAQIMDLAIMVIPFLVATSMMGQTISVFVNDRESVFITIVFTSVFFVFLAGVSWPRYAMHPFWVAVGNLIPSTWAYNSYMLMQTNGATLAQESHSHLMLWLLAALYFVFACIVERFLLRARYRRMKYYAEQDPGSLHREELRRQAVDN